MNPELQTLKRKNSLRGARVVTTAIAIFLGSFLITGTARADLPKNPIPDVGGFLAPDDDVMKAELKAMAAWGKLQKDLKTCLDKGAKNQSKGKDSRLDSCMVRALSLIHI